MARLKSKLDVWVKEGFLTNEQAQAITVFEERPAERSWFLFSMLGLGIIVIAIGLVSLVAANWANISDIFKLSAFFFLQLCLAWCAVYLTQNREWLREALLLALALSIGAGIGLIAQIYNLESESWRGVSFWITLSLPLVLLSRRSLLSHLWFVGLAATISLYLMDIPREHYNAVVLGVPSVAYIFLILAVFGGAVLPGQFIRAAAFWSLLSALVVFPLFGHNGWYYNHFGGGANAAAALPTMAFALLAVWALGRSYLKHERMRLRALQIALVFAAIYALFPFLLKIGKHDFIGTVLFLIYCFICAIAAALNERRRLFDLITIIIGVRFIIVYFEVFGSLTQTGVGLIISGAAIIFCTYIWHRYRRGLESWIKEAVGMGQSDSNGGGEK